MYYWDDDRRKILAERKRQVNQEAVKRSQELVEEGKAYNALINSRGWELLVEQFIKPKLSVERILSAEPKELRKIQTEMKLLTEMLNFIENKLKWAQLEGNVLSRMGLSENIESL